MDPTILAQNLVTFLVPFLPYLLDKIGDATAEVAVEKFGEAAWKKAKALWGKLRGKEKIEQAAQDTAAMPDDPDTQAAMRLQIKKSLAADEVLMTEMARLWEEAKIADVTTIASGKRSIAIGGDVSGSTIITGDSNIISNHSQVKE